MKLAVELNGGSRAGDTVVVKGALVNVQGHAERRTGIAGLLIYDLRICSPDGWWRVSDVHLTNVQFRAMDTSKSGADLGLPVLIALAGALIGKSVHGGMICVGGINLVGAIGMICNAAS